MECSILSYQTVLYNGETNVILYVICDDGTEGYLAYIDMWSATDNIFWDDA
jgi:hypothetical protein